MNKKNFIYVLACMMLLLASCTDDLGMKNERFNTHTSTVRFSTKVWKGETVNVGSRALTTREGEVENLTLLYFTFSEDANSWILNSYETLGKDDLQSNNAGGYTFEAKNVPTSQDPGNPTKVIIEFLANFDFANYRTEGQGTSETFGEYIQGKEINEVMALLIDKNELNVLKDDGEEQGQLLTMWGYQAEADYSNGGTIPTVTLVPDVSKLSINVDENAQINFKLLQVKLYNPLTEGRIVPFINRESGSNLPQCPIEAAEFYNQTIPSEPTNAVIADKPYCTKLYDADTDFLNGTYPEYTLYTYARQNDSDGKYWDGTANQPLDRDHRMYLILKGSYYYETEWVEGWYRVDIADIERQDGKLTKFDLINIIRRYNYQINLIKVTGPGYADEEAAKVGPSSDVILLDVRRITNEEAKDVISNGQYRMGLSEKEVYYNDNNGRTEAIGVEVSRLYLYPLINSDENIDGDGYKGELNATFPTLSVGGGRQTANINIDNDPTSIKIVVQSDENDEKSGTIIKGQQKGTANGLSFEFVKGDSEQTDYVSIKIDRKAYDVNTLNQNRKVVLRVTAGNLIREITIWQGKEGTFSFGGALDSQVSGETYPTYYVSWRPGQTLTIPVTLNNAMIPEAGLTCLVDLEYETSSGFLSYATGVGILEFTGAENEKKNLTLHVDAGYYGMSNEIYRVNKVAVTAQGMKTGVFCVKQSKYMDGVFGNAVVGIYRDFNDDGEYELDFGDVETQWRATITQGNDFIQIATGDGSLTASSIKDEGPMKLKYKLSSDGVDTGVDRYGKILLEYGNFEAADNGIGSVSKHTIFVHQGFNPVQTTLNGSTIEWMAYNLDVASAQGKTDYTAPSDYKHNPGYPGIMFKLRNITDWYYGGGTWGTPYDDQDIPTALSGAYEMSWSITGGKRDNFSIYQDWTGDYNPCPDNYRVATLNDWNHLKFEVTGSNIGVSLQDVPTSNWAGNLYAQYNFTYALWGKVTNGSTEDFRAGVLFVKFDNDDVDNGDIIKTLFIPACGTLSQSFTTNDKTLSGEGRLLYGHYNPSVTTDEYKYGNQGGAYWMSGAWAESTGEERIRVVDIYHDPYNNIGLIPLESFGQVTYGQHDAMPIRCVRDKP